MGMRYLASLIVLPGLLIGVAACSSDSAEESNTLTGVVISVDGTLQGIESFTVRLTDGSDSTFVPVPGLLFDHAAPLSHLRDHLANGDPIQVEYRQLTDGTLSATAVGDG